MDTRRPWNSRPLRSAFGVWGCTIEFSCELGDRQESLSSYNLVELPVILFNEWSYHLTFSKMKQQILTVLIGMLWVGATAQCKIALDTVDEFDSTRIIASAPITIGYLIPTGALAEDLDGEIYAEEAKVIFSYANENNIRSFFLTLGVLEHKFRMIQNDYSVYLKFVDGPIIKVYNEPDDPEFDRNLIMWRYIHTCVIPLDIYHLMRMMQVEKIRIVYDGYKSTIVLSEEQRQALQQAVLCVAERLAEPLPEAVIKP